MRPFASNELAEGQWTLAEPGHNYLVYSASGGTLRVDLGGSSEGFVGRWLDPATGAGRPAVASASRGGVAEFRASGRGPAVLWVTRKP
jgi:hypothetical protein